MEQIVQTDDLGKDEATAQLLLKKHKVNLKFKKHNVKYPQETQGKMPNECPELRIRHHDFTIATKAPLDCHYGATCLTISLTQALEEEINGYEPMISGLKKQQDNLSSQDRLLPITRERQVTCILWESVEIKHTCLWSCYSHTSVVVQISSFFLGDVV